MRRQPADFVGRVLSQIVGQAHGLRLVERAVGVRLDATDEVGEQYRRVALVRHGVGDLVVDELVDEQPCKMRPPTARSRV